MDRMYNKVKEVKMTKDKSVRVPVTEQELKKLVNESQKAGYRSLAAYLRDKGLNNEKHK